MPSSTHFFKKVCTHRSFSNWLSLPHRLTQKFSNWCNESSRACYAWICQRNSMKMLSKRAWSLMSVGYPLASHNCLQWIACSHSLKASSSSCWPTLCSLLSKSIQQETISFLIALSRWLMRSVAHSVSYNSSLTKTSDLVKYSGSDLLKAWRILTKWVTHRLRLSASSRAKCELTLSSMQARVFAKTQVNTMSSSRINSKRLSLMTKCFSTAIKLILKDNRWLTPKKPGKFLVISV